MKFFLIQRREKSMTSLVKQHLRMVVRPVMDHMTINLTSMNSFDTLTMPLHFVDIVKVMISTVTKVMASGFSLVVHTADLFYFDDLFSDIEPNEGPFAGGFGFSGFDHFGSGDSYFGTNFGNHHMSDHQFRSHHSHKSLVKGLWDTLLLYYLSFQCLIK
ncbi:uncharacterized protein LOC143236044 [Tachypleus tridentatus]|uniref:uncharacterized protein LOC143236044 n=1 Tax=Tachypleus tridentatus TaxID=6853 RepID=UPI003FCFD754